MSELTLELQSFLAECEETFADRYTDKDPEYLKHCQEKTEKIPIEEHWYLRYHYYYLF